MFLAQFSWKSRVVRPAAFAALALVAATPASAGQTVKFGGIYDVSVSGLRFASASLSLILRDNAYSAKLNMRSSGIGRLFSSGHGNAEASGWVRGARVQPSRYYLDSTGDKIRTSVNMALSRGSIRKLAVSPPLKERPDRVPVTRAHKRNVLDPLSAILMPVKGKVVAGRAACDRTIPVFDGWSRYNVRLSYKETKTINRPDYTGPVVVCSARWQPVAGHRLNKKSVEYMANNRDMETWLTPVADLPLLTPYRISIATKAGPLVVQARKIKVQHEAKHASADPVQ